MIMKVELSLEELNQAVQDYAKAHGANLPAGSKVVFQCYGPDVQSVGGIKSISASIVVAEQTAAPAATA